MVVVKEVVCRSILSRSRIYGVDYSINPFTGCCHGCVYCYARFMCRYASPRLSWGEFVNVKVNAPEALSFELRKAKRGLILISSVTDPYQPLEAKYELTRKILEVIAKRSFPVSILTKSPLVARDVDVIKKIPECEVGFTIVTLDETVRENFEPKAPPILKRLEALWALNQNDIKTYVFLGPVLPYLTEETLEDLLKKLTEVGVTSITVDKLNIKAGNWQPIHKTLETRYPTLVHTYKEVLFKPNLYYEKLRSKILESCKHYNLTADFCY